MIKKLIAGLLLASTLYACGGGTEKTADAGTEAKPAEKDDITKNPDYQNGLSLIAKSDCLTCHQVEEKITGPAYHAVANKYPNTPATIDTLAYKIINGGSGNWGTIPMTAHVGLSEDDAKQMVKYIMLLKTQ